MDASDSTFRAVGAEVAEAMNHWESEDDPDTLQSLPRLQAVNTLGFVTSNSQIGMVEDSVRQRAYVNAICHKRHEDALHRMGMRTNLVVGITDASDNDSIYVSKSLFNQLLRYPVTTAGLKPCTFFGGVAFWKPSVHLDPLGRPLSERVESRLKRQGIIVQAFDPEWGRPMYLLDRIIETLQ